MRQSQAPTASVPSFLCCVDHHASPLLFMMAVLTFSFSHIIEGSQEVLLVNVHLHH